MLIEIPQDIFNKKSKLMAGMSARELVCVVGSIFIGIATYTMLPQDMEMSTKAMITALPPLPLMVFGFVKLYEQPIEKILPKIIKDNYMKTRNRLYEQEESYFFEPDHLTQEEIKAKEKEDKKNGVKKEPEEITKVKPSKTYKPILKG